MAEHRVSVLSASLRRYDDPERSSDPRIRAIVAQLRSVEPAPPMRVHFRAELRAQLVSVTPRLVVEGVGVERPMTHPAVKTASGGNRELSGAGLRTGRSGSIALTRPAAIAAAVVALFAMVLGGAVWMSRGAVPGDTLYGLKRADEGVQLSLTSGDTARGEKYLQFATERTHEVSVLLSRSAALAAGAGASAGGGVNAHTANLVATALDSSDSDVRNASRLLGAAAVQSDSTHPLQVLTDWAPQQAQRLRAISARIPSNSPLASRAAASQQLVSEVATRSQTLSTMLDCHCLTQAPTDSLGPVPCIVCTPTGTPTTSVIGSNTNPTTDAVANSQVTTGTSSSESSQLGGRGEPSGAASSSSGTGGGLPLPSLSNAPTIQLPSMLPKPSGDRTPSCVVNVIGICVKI